MKTMNLFGTKEKPKRKNHSDNFKRKAVELANEIGISQAAEELDVSISSISNWKKMYKQAFSSAPIQDSDGNLVFNVDNHIYTLNVNSEEERDSVLVKVNSNSEYTWDWFKEERGEEHWVLYNTNIYEKYKFPFATVLSYKEDCALAPILPVNATSCCGMFSFLENTLLDVLNFDTSNIVDMNRMFAMCNFVKGLDLSKFNTSKVRDMSYMFYVCKSLKKLDLSNFDTSKVINMSRMFGECHSLTTLDLSNFNTYNITDMSWMFKGCSKLTSLDVTSFDTSKVTNMYWMFLDCSSLTTLDLSSFNLSNVINMDLILSSCTSLKTVKATDPKLIGYIRNNYPQIEIEN